jgi:copper chaperone NosL
MPRIGRKWIWRGAGLAFVLNLYGCAEPTAPTAPAEIADDTACALDGMLLRDYPGPKAQIHYGEAPPEFFCDTVEMFAMVLNPEQARRVEAVYTQDMGRADWNNPRGNWIDAKTAFYVEGSSLKGSMGPTFAAFARQADAEAFARKNGGRVLKFSDVTPQMADLRGGASRDEGM